MTGVAREELQKLEDRARVSQTRLNEIKMKHKESLEKVTCEELIAEAATKLKNVVDAVQKASDAETPFLMGVEELPLDQMIEAVKECETTTTAANTTASICRMFVATKLVEARRFQEGPSQEATTKLKECQTELEAQMKRLTELKQNTAARKKDA